MNLADAKTLLSRPVLIPLALFALAFCLHRFDLPTVAAVTAGVGAGFFIGFIWGWLRGYFSAMEESRYYRGDP